MKYSKILFAVDGSALANRALAEAPRPATAIGSEQVAHVIDNSYLRYEVDYVDLTDLRASLLEGGQILLDEAKAKATVQKAACNAPLAEGSAGARSA
ncbi:universal stress protein [Cupriavidus sp. 2TAF22]|uniref:hypothetical protein n=1 Tax=unclassified Cupriavidus TaxID=2640874 RepID=UPI003F8E7493